MANLTVYPEARVIVERGLAAKVAGIVEPMIEALGYLLVQVRLLNINGCTLQIMADLPDGGIKVSDCAAISNQLSPLLDVADPIAGAYNLEVSSPGINRPLVRKHELRQWGGHQVKARLITPLDTKKTVRGILGEVTDEAVVVETRVRDVCHQLQVPFSEIDELKLVLTEELIKGNHHGITRH